MAFSSTGRWSAPREASRTDRAFAAGLLNVDCDQSERGFTASGPPPRKNAPSDNNTIAAASPVPV